MASKNKAPRKGAMTFSMEVMPEQKYLDKAIEQNGFCDPKRCWHKLAIACIAEKWGSDTNPHIRVDAGTVKMNYEGYRYVALQPRHVKRSMLLFDKKRYDLVHIRPYRLLFRRTTKIIPVPAERQEQINEARRNRIVEGRPDKKRPAYPTMHKRVEGFSAIV